MATAKEIKQHLELALSEIGEIKPWFDKDIDEWIFSHPNYPVEYGGSSPEEVIRNYPKYLKEFIKFRLDDHLSPHVEKRTKGHGGKREGAGRPVGSKKESTARVSIPIDIATWFKKNPHAVEMVRALIHQSKTRRS